MSSPVTIPESITAPARGTCPGPVDVPLFTPECGPELGVIMLWPEGNVWEAEAHGGALTSPFRFSGWGDPQTLLGLAVLLYPAPFPAELVCKLVDYHAAITEGEPEA